jgi:alpha-tubulin suppressor-like RCC1 family protein
MKTKRIQVFICLLGMLILFAFNSEAQPVIKIVAGNGGSLFLKSDGSLWGMGSDSYGTLGDGAPLEVSIIETNRPELLAASGVTAIAGDGVTSLFIKSDGSLWGMGYNGGALGNGSINPTNHPQLIVASNVTAIVTGDAHSLFLKSDGSLWVMGLNDYGQLGDGKGLANGTYNNTNRPEQIVSTNVTMIATGGAHSLFLKSDGSLWAMGRNLEGQLGDGTYNNTNQPELIVPSNVIAIAVGEYHSLFLKSSGSLWGMGNNVHGELGDSTYNNTNLPEMIVTNNVTAIAAGDHSLFLKNDGSLWGMGEDYSGSLGDGIYTTNAPFGTNQPEQILAAYNQISDQLLSGGNLSLSFVGIAGKKYALDRSFNLSSPNWLPQVTNLANSFGALMFTNTPNTTTNNFWRIRSVP